MAAQTNMASSRCEAPSFGEAFPCLLFPFALFQSLELAVPLFSAFLSLSSSAPFSPLLEADSWASILLQPSGFVTLFLFIC
jgi:hypothetical protein